MVSVLLAVLVIGAHTFLETPPDQFHTWAHNSSSFAHSIGHPNLSNISSPTIGNRFCYF